MRFPGTDHIIIRLRFLQHAIHRLDVFRSVSPVAAGVEIAKVDLFIQTGESARCPA